MRAILVGDVHLKDKAPSMRTDTYREDIFDKLEWIVSYANKQDVDALIQLGDMFDVKVPSQNSHYLVQKTAEILGKSNAPVLIVPGNHDVRAGRIESLPEQPLGTLSLHPNIRLMLGTAFEDAIYGVPFFNDEEELNKWMEGYGGEKLLVTHASIFPKGQEPIFDYIAAEDFSNKVKAPHVAYGDIHNPHHHYFEGQTWFCNNGAVSRGSTHEETMARKLKVTLYNSDTDGDPFTDVPIPYKPASEVFRIDLKADKETTKSLTEDFRNSLTSTSFQSLSLESVIDSARMKLPEKAVNELNEILETV